MKLLIICDYQNDFVEGSLGFDRAKELDERIVTAIENHDDIAFILNKHDKDYINSLEGKLIPVEHCVIGTEGEKVFGKVSEYLDKAKCVLYHSGLTSLDLIEFLRNNEYEFIDVCGLLSNTTVTATAILSKTVCPNTLITIYKNLTDSYDKQLEVKAFNILNSMLIEVK